MLHLSCGALQSSHPSPSDSFLSSCCSGNLIHIPNAWYTLFLHLPASVDAPLEGWQPTRTLITLTHRIAFRYRVIPTRQGSTCSTYSIYVSSHFMASKIRYLAVSNGLMLTLHTGMISQLRQIRPCVRSSGVLLNCCPWLFATWCNL